MKCANHEEQEAVAICSVCHQPVCEDCLVNLGNRQFCRNCLESRVGEDAKTAGSPRSTFWAFSLSIIPGAGYMYLGLMKRGLQTMIIFYGTIFLAAVTEFMAITALVLPVVIFYTIFDTLQLLKQINQGQAVEDSPLIETGFLEARGGLVGIALIIVGALALLNNLLPNYLPYHYLMNRLVPPLLILALGIYMLYKNTGRGEQNGGSD
jgi:TM2 domain-containing membrane protein YozV